MYQIDKTANRISPLQEKKFSELGFREREHLQEWIAANPEVLGEELLIIQKEFDGFDETRERLDLLALDKQGHLVVIENKLDDSGRDVTWQALKYASYCAGLTKSQIVAIYQQYLDKYEQGDSAQQRLTDFFDDIEFDELTLNPGSDQRIIFVAANFRREVTSTALWLMDHRIRIQCIKAVPFAMGDQLLLNLDQIIPVKEAEEYMIGIREKSDEIRVEGRQQANREVVRKRFWDQFVPMVKAAELPVFTSVEPSVSAFLIHHCSQGGVKVVLELRKVEVRVKLEFKGKAGMETFRHFDKLAFSQSLGMQYEEKQLNDNFYQFVIVEPVDGFEESEWEGINTWLLETLRKLVAAAEPELRNIGVNIAF
ncbi:hypothetical protein PVT68_16090 [Microbulbifer bruguierae]|uniref:DUF4268 domain-containing protein n=1 Tax=Microbulbifer bruguierae TaxID=3029061 RepID=A0ABY8NBG5_9GAMM|nr:hypothetical protein [Microbulbifer bruguierae]WGL16275.1 hypothetical protein PVT68_16090 [Microbulbifer bruguierae]